VLTNNLRLLLSTGRSGQQQLQLQTHKLDHVMCATTPSIGKCLYAMPSPRALMLACCATLQDLDCPLACCCVLQVTVIYIPGEDGQMIEVRGVPSARLRARSGQQAQQQQQQPQQQAGLFTGNSSSTSIAGAGETAPVAPAAPVPALDQAPVQIPAMSDTRAQGTG
jgi:hypothetical protein